MHSDKESFVQLMQENKGIIYKICRTYCADVQHRDDLSQEIMYNLWKAFASYNRQYKFSTWMYRISLNVAISFYRKENKLSHHLAVDENLMIFESTTETDENVEGNIRLLEKFISALGEIDKSLMILYLDDKSYKEISGIMGMSETNVATKISRIKDKLKNNFATTQK